MIVNGNTSLESVVNGQSDITLGSSAEVESEIVIHGEISLSSEEDGDSSVDLLLDGIEGSFYIIEAGAHEIYGGDYDITPQSVAQTLLTADKLMEDNVTIRKIPTYEVSNDSGGKTFYIAESLED